MTSACVVGAGPAGLLAARHLRDSGLEVTVYEQAEAVGGVWILRPPESSLPRTAMYTQLTTNLPGALMAFSDHPFPLRTRLFPTQQEVLEYLDSYAKRFDLDSLMHFRTTVVDAVWNAADGCWRVEVADAEGMRSKRDFAKLVVCSGHYYAATRPELPGADEFPGNVSHSFDFYDAAAYAGKSVLVIGSSASAGDIATMLIQRAPGCTVHLSARSPPTAVGKALVGPALQLGLQLHGSVKHLTKDGTAVLAAPAKGWNVERIDDVEVHVDIVLCATGYRYEFPFLRSSNLEDVLCGDGSSMRHLYRRVFYSRNPSLAIVGAPNVLIPPWFVFEQQVKWVAEVWSGHVQLPAEDEMEREASSRYVPQPARGAARDNLGLGTPAYCNELAALSGSEGYYSVLLRSKIWRILASKAFGHSASQAML